ncbi:hypothetical protein E2I00_017358, partial [Balaenoptera physalus]
MSGKRWWPSRNPSGKSIAERPVTLKDKFTPKKIMISKYYWHSCFLEANSASLVCDAESDQQISVSHSTLSENLVKPQR